MIGSPHRRSRSGLWFAAFTIISLLLLLASQTDPARTLQSISARALDPIRQTIGGIGSGIAGVFGTIGEIDRLRSENDELRQPPGVGRAAHRRAAGGGGRERRAA